MQMNSLRVLAGCAVLVMPVIGCFSPTKPPETPVTKVEQTIEGELVSVTVKPWPRVAKVQGSFFADEITTIAAKVPGRIVEINCDLGDQVDQDMVLIRLDPREYELLAAQSESQLTQARAAIGLRPGDSVDKLNPLNAPPVREAKAVLDEAKQTVKRLQTLFSQNAVVATDLEAAQAVESVADARFNSALNSVREKIALVGVQTASRALAEQRLTDTNIRAPFKGMIQNRIVSIGSYVNVGQPMLELVGTSVLRYRAAVPERFVSDLRMGQKLILLSHDNRHREVKITRISPALDSVSRSLIFEAEVPNEDGQLRSGTFSQADVVLQEDAESVCIPVSSLVRFAGVQKVWKVTDGKVREAVVEIGREQAGLIEVLTGLNPGDMILKNGRNGGVGKYKEAAAVLAGTKATDSKLGEVVEGPNVVNKTPVSALEQINAPEKGKTSTSGGSDPIQVPLPVQGEATAAAGGKNPSANGLGQ